MKNNVYWHPRETPDIWTENKDIKACLEGFICSCFLKANFKTH